MGMNILNLSASKRQFLKAIVEHVEFKAPDVATMEVGKNRFEGEEKFSVEYNQYLLECKRRSVFVDTSDLDYNTGTGYSYDIIYDEIAVISAFDTETDEENEELCNDLNEMLSVC